MSKQVGKKILASTITKARLKHTGYNGQAPMLQAELIERVNDYMGKECISAATISLWERGYRPVPVKYIDALVSIFGYPESYFYGETDENGNPLNVPTGTREEILKKELYRYDKMPVYIEFKDYEYADGWAIYNAVNDVAVFADKVVSEITKRTNITIYEKQDQHEVNSMINVSEPCEMITLLQSKRVYVTIRSKDPYVRGLYDGWYHNNTDHTALINERGLTLPYDGLNVSYQAYAVGSINNLNAPKKKEIKPEDI